MKRSGSVFKLNPNDEFEEVTPGPGLKDSLTMHEQYPSVAEISGVNPDIMTSRPTPTMSPPLLPVTGSSKESASKTATTSRPSHTPSGQDRDTSVTSDTSPPQDLNSDHNEEAPETTTSCVAEEVSSRDSKAPMRPEERGTAPHLPRASMVISTERSPLRPSSIQARLDQFKRKEVALAQKLQEAKQQMQKSCDRADQLYTAEKVEVALHNKQRIAVEVARKKSKEARSFLDEQKEILAQTHNQIKHIRKKITDVEGSVVSYKTHLSDVEKEIRSLDQAQQLATRQADILELKTPEVDALVRAARSDTTFLGHLRRVEEGTATVTMCRDIKSRIFDVLTCVKQDELDALVKTILGTQKEQEETARREIDKAKEERGHGNATGKRAAGKPPLGEPAAVRPKH
ncbi:hypothetical protein PV08_09153 [Exophiala spinifera]|uniref:Uncharacterized protein n=1 Tax=Exophiala spinifera TaxID=91928 RepID=A0A0D2AZK3_9EURO|nr:uncharacterized protein PV08_09153 [Exophiala spinifera]KIW11880.1 hypothetical protein PV08_09153 [Exophiala spinifera]